MKVSSRDKRALALLIATGASALPFLGFSRKTVSPAPANQYGAVTRLRKLQNLASTLPSQERASLELGLALKHREEGLIFAADDKLAQEKLLNIVQRLALAQTPPLEIRNKELAPSRVHGDYGEVLVSVNTTCRMEQLINFISDLTAQPEAVATEELHIYGVHPENKLMQIRLTIGGLVKRELIPQQRGLNEF